MSRLTLTLLIMAKKKTDIDIIDEKGLSLDDLVGSDSPIEIESPIEGVGVAGPAPTLPKLNTLTIEERFKRSIAIIDQLEQRIIELVELLTKKPADAVMPSSAPIVASETRLHQLLASKAVASILIANGSALLEITDSDGDIDSSTFYADADSLLTPQS